MPTNKTYLALLIASLIGLTGCLDDALEDGDGNSGTPPPVNPEPGPDPDPDPDPTDPVNVVLYGQNADGSFTLMASDGQSTEAVTTDGSSLEGIKASADVDAFGEINFARETTGTGQLMLTSTSAYDFTKSLHGGNGVLSFDLKVNGADNTITDGKLSPVNVTLKSGEAAASVDISSVMQAAKASEAYQPVHIPLSCFTEAEKPIDITTVDQPFSLHVESIVDYSVKNIALIGEGDGKTPGTANVLECENNSYLLTDISGDTQIFKRTNNENTGWGMFTPNKKAVNGDMSFDNLSEMQLTGIFAKPGMYNIDAETPFRIYFSAYDATKNALPSLEELPRKDFSQFVESGELQLHFRMDDVGTTWDQASKIYLNVQLITPHADIEGAPETGYDNSQVHAIEWTNTLQIGELYQVNIPLKNLLVDKNGAINSNVVQHIDQILITPDFVSNTPDTKVDLENFKVMFGDINLIMNPAQPGTGQPISMDVPPTVTP